jgi:hypothetical protein
MFFPGTEKFERARPPKTFSRYHVETEMKYSCPHCDYTCATQHMISHIVKTHKDVLAVENNRISLQGCVKRGSMYRMGIKNESGTCSVKCCFGCNKFWAKGGLAEAHEKDCPNKAEHKKVCESFLPANAMVERLTDTTAVASDLLQKMQEQIKQLEKKNARLEKEHTAFQKSSFKWDKIQNILVNSYDEDFRLEIVDKLNDIKEEDDEFEIDWNDEMNAY